MSMMKKRIVCLLLACIMGLLCGCELKKDPVIDTLETDVGTDSDAVTTLNGDEDITPDNTNKKDANYIVFDSQDKVDQCTVASGVKLSYNAKGYMDVSFRKEVSNPYVTVSAPSDRLYAKTYAYIAAIVKTNDTSSSGKMRFSTTTDSSVSSNASFLHNDTSDWQLVYIYNAVSDGMDAGAKKTLNGDYTKLRFEMFETVSDTSTTYSIKALGVFSSVEKMKTWAEEQIGMKEFKYTVDELVAMNAGLYLGSEFSSPSSRYLPSHYAYSINDDYMTQINKDEANGFGGICSNHSFTSDYLKNDSEFAKLDAAFAAMAEKGMYGWLYDEYHWPSGKAFGQVLEGNPEYEEIAIRQYMIEGSGSNVSYTKPSDAIKIEYAMVKDSTGKFYHIDFSDTAINVSAPSSSWVLYVYLREKTSTQAENSADFRTLRSVNKLSLGATQKFINLTYQKYYDKMPNGFSNVEAFFTDEPAFYFANFSQLMWEDSLPDVYKQMWGVDIWDTLPSLYSGDTVADKLARIRYYETAAKMVSENYYGAIADWCEEHGTAFSGHLLYTEMLKDHVQRYGGDLINLLGAMQYPGEDLLKIEPQKMMTINEYGTFFMGMKYVSSAARNFERSHAFVEYNPDPYGNAPSIAEDALLYCKGGATVARFMGIDKFSLMNPQNSMTNDQLKEWNAYIGRMNVVLENAEMNTGVAVFYPIKTVQAYHYAGVKHYSGTTVAEIDNKYNNLCRNMILSGTDFNVINEDNIIGSTIENGVMTIGYGSYKVIVVAYSEVMSLECLQKFDAFVQSGGKILWVDEKPSLADDATEQSAFATLISTYASDTVFDNENICSQIGAFDNVEATFQNLNGDVMVSQYEKDGKTIYFLCNWQKKLKSVTVNLPKTTEISVYYPGIGVIEVIDSSDTCTVNIPAYEGAFIIVE